jgi:hypothetical protein
LGSQRAGDGFEGAYQAMKDLAKQFPENSQTFRQFHDMVSGMFHQMRHTFAVSSLGTDQKHRPIEFFLHKFDAFYTLNQDTFIESNYLNTNIREGSAGKLLSIEMPGVERPPGQEFQPPGLWQPKLPPYFITERAQPYIKLHGSSNWTLPGQADLMLILGGNKATEINSQPLLSWYHQQFRDALKLPNTRVVIIGYSFSDSHINNALCDAAPYGTQFFIIDPSGLGVVDKRNKAAQIAQPRETLLETLIPNIAGASRRDFRQSMTSDGIERSKILRFLQDL